MDDLGGLLQVLQKPGAILCTAQRLSAAMSSVGGLGVGKVQWCCTKPMEKGARGVMLMSHGT